MADRCLCSGLYVPMATTDGSRWYRCASCGHELLEKPDEVDLVAKLAQAEKERDAYRVSLVRICGALTDANARTPDDPDDGGSMVECVLELGRERDTARAEVERLRGALDKILLVVSPNVFRPIDAAHSHCRCAPAVKEIARTALASVGGKGE